MKNTKTTLLISYWNSSPHLVLIAFCICRLSPSNTTICRSYVTCGIRWRNRHGGDTGDVLKGYSCSQRCQDATGRVRSSISESCTIGGTINVRLTLTIAHEINIKDQTWDRHYIAHQIDVHNYTCNWHELLHMTLTLFVIREININYYTPSWRTQLHVKCTYAITYLINVHFFASNQRTYLHVRLLWTVTRMTNVDNLTLMTCDMWDVANVKRMCLGILFPLSCPSNHLPFPEHHPYHHHISLLLKPSRNL